MKVIQSTRQLRGVECSYISPEGLKERQTLIYTTQRREPEVCSSRTSVYRDWSPITDPPCHIPSPCKACASFHELAGQTVSTLRLFLLTVAFTKRCKLEWRQLPISDVCFAKRTTKEQILIFEQNRLDSTASPHCGVHTQ